MSDTRFDEIDVRDSMTYAQYWLLRGENPSTFRPWAEIDLTFAPKPPPEPVRRKQLRWSGASAWSREQEG
jgi:hypothetical protein